MAGDLESIGTRHCDDMEDIESAFMTPADIRKAIKDGTFSQALHVASFYLGVEASRIER